MTQTSDFRHWSNEREPEDAPVHYTSEQASAWASGYNSAVAEATKQLDDAFRAEMGRSDTMMRDR